MSDKMREAFEKWYMTNTFAHVDHLSVFYNDLNCYSTPIANQCWKAWQAAQSVSVPVVGEVVAWLQYRDHSGTRPTTIHLCDSDANGAFDVIRKPATSITAAELERLRRNDARYMWLRDLKNDETAVRLLKAECDTELDEAIDAAIAGEK